MMPLVLQLLPARVCEAGTYAEIFSGTFGLTVDALMHSLKSQKNDIFPAQFRDLESVRQAQRGDPDAFRRLVEKYQSHLGRLLWRFTRNKTDHEELVQESFVQAYLSLHTYQAKAPFEHWLSRIATRVGYRYWKQVKRHTHSSIQDSDWQQLEESRDPANPEQASELVYFLLAKLPPRDRLVLTLRYLEQCSVEQTARQTGWTASLVKVQTHRAKQKLKKILENTDIEFEM
jgi:RNA polymerase sigma-70 factor (ECF subfamily)